MSKIDEDYKEWRKIKNYETVEFNNFIGKIIKDKRKELKVSPFIIAKSLKITYQTYNKYENGQINIPIHTLFLIADILNISFNSLIDKYYKEVSGGIDKIQFHDLDIPVFSDIELEKSIDIVKKIYNTGDRKAIFYLKTVLDLVDSIINK